MIITILCVAVGKLYNYACKKNDKCDILDELLEEAYRLEVFSHENEKAEALLYVLGCSFLIGAPDKSKAMAFINIVVGLIFDKFDFNVKTTQQENPLILLKSRVDYYNINVDAFGRASLLHMLALFSKNKGIHYDVSPVHLERPRGNMTYVMKLGEWMQFYERHQFPARLRAKIERMI